MEPIIGRSDITEEETRAMAEVILSTRGLPMRSDADMYTRLAGIQQLWRELGRTPRSSPTYEVLMEQIRAESLAYQAIIDVRQGRPAKP